MKIIYFKIYYNITFCYINAEVFKKYNHNHATQNSELKKNVYCFIFKNNFFKYVYFLVKKKKTFKFINNCLLLFCL